MLQASKLYDSRAQHKGDYWLRRHDMIKLFWHTMQQPSEASACNLASSAQASEYRCMVDFACLFAHAPSSCRSLHQDELLPWLHTSPNGGIELDIKRITWQVRMVCAFAFKTSWA